MTTQQMINQFIALLILLAFLIFVEYAVGWQRLLAPWHTMSPGVLLGAIILVFVSYGVRALRQSDYFRAEMRGAFGLSFRLMLQHNFFNNLLPMRSGEISFPVLMSRYFAIQFTRSVPGLIWFRVLDLFALGMSAVVVISQSWLGWPAALIAGAVVLIAPRLVYHILQTWRGRYEPHAEHGWRKALSHLLHGLPANSHDFWRSWTWTLANWIVKLAVFAWILRFFLPMPFAAAWVGAVGGDLSSVLPIHGIAGAGTYEAGVVSGLLLFRIDTQAALAAAVNLHLFVLASTLLGGACSLLIPRTRRPLKTEDN